MFQSCFRKANCVNIIIIISIISLLLFSVVFLNTRFSGITQCAFPTIVKSRPRHQLEIMHQQEGLLAPVISSCAHTPPPPPTPPPSSPPQATAEHLPAFVSPGEGHLQILRCSGPGICQPGASPELLTGTRFPIRIYLHQEPIKFDGLLTYTEDFNGKTRRLAHLWRRKKNCKGMFSIWCMHLFIAY